MAITESVQKAYEEAARKRKVVALISVIDRHARASRLDPLSQTFAEELPRMSVQWWRQAALGAAIHAPSEITIGEVISFYRGRAVAPAQAGA